MAMRESRGRKPFGGGAEAEPLQKLYPYLTLKWDVRTIFSIIGAR